MDGWFVVLANSRRETAAAERLSEFDPYVPRFRAATGRIKPLFAGYLFCRATEHWSPIKTALHVRALLMNGERPATLPEAAIAYWRAMEVDGLVQLPSPPRFHAGERLVVLSGSLKDRVVIHSGMSARHREMVLIAMMGSEVKLAIATGDLINEMELREIVRLRENRNRLRVRHR